MSIERAAAAALFYCPKVRSENVCCCLKRGKKYSGMQEIYNAMTKADNLV